MAKKKSKKKPTAKKVKTAKVAKVSAMSPVDFKRAFKKFRTKHQIVAVMPERDGYAVSLYAAGQGTVVRRFTFAQEKSSVMPDSMWRSAQLALAIWLARFYARHHQTLPSAKFERSKRRHIWKKVLRGHQSHMAMRAVVKSLDGSTSKVPERHIPQVQTYILIYDPKQRLQKRDAVEDKYFRLHSAACGRLDHDRKKVCRPGVGEGASWVLEANGPADAIRKQVREFDEDDMGWEPSDFEVHDCRGGK